MPRTRSLKWSELKLGAAGIAALVLASALIFAVGGQGGFFWQRYPLYTRFDDVAGLKAGAIVRLNGMEVGKVTRVEFAGAQVEVRMEVSRDVRPLITDESEATMGTLTVLGEPIVDIRAAATGTPLADDAFVRPGAAGGMAALATRAARGLDEAGALIADVRAGQGALGSLVMDDDMRTDLQALVGSAASVARHLEKGRGTLGALAQDPGAYLALESALQNLSAAAERVNAGGGPVGRLLYDEAMGGSLASASRSIDEISGRLARGEGTAGKLLTDGALYDRTLELTRRTDSLLAALESGEGTAGQLLRDRQLYDNVNRVTLELAKLLDDIRADPKKYLSVEFSVF